MAKIALAPATLEHVADVAGRMRAADVAEVWASSAMMPYDALLASVRRTPRPLAGMVDGRAECLFGVAPLTLLGDVGMPWLLGTDELPRHARAFLRRNRGYIEIVRAEYGLLTNYVDDRNTTSIRWLEWLGFAIMSPEPYGPFRLPFRRFELRSNRV